VLIIASRNSTSASNPESGAISYQYDNNGNLTQKTDTRNIVTTYQYDALNRSTSVNYSNTTIGSPDVPTIPLGYSVGDGIRQQFTLKERDNETGLDYFGERYDASVQGRFTGADSYDITLERQNTSAPEEADALFRDYLFQPQHWNRYAYALNKSPQIRRS